MSKPRLTKLDKRILRNVDPYGVANASRIKSALRSVILNKPEVPKDMRDPHAGTNYRKAILSYGLGDIPDTQYIGPSPYKPTNASNPDAKYIRLHNIDKQAYLDRIFVDGEFRGDVSPGFTSSLPESYRGKTSGPLGHYHTSLGEDEHGKYVSYYDIWDFKSGLANKYMDRIPEVYDRIYYKDTDEGPKFIPMIEDNQPLDGFKNGGKMKKKLKRIPMAGGGPIIDEASSGVLDDLDMSATTAGSAFGPYGAAVGALIDVGKTVWNKQQAGTSAVRSRFQRLNAPDYMMAMGGGLPMESPITEYNGNTHAQGGIPLPGHNVEVEDGETRTNDVIHSDKIKVNKAILKRFPGVFKKGDVGSSIADVTKKVKKDFEKRGWDKWNDEAAKIILADIEDVSTILGEEKTIMENGGKMKAQNGTRLGSDESLGTEVMGYGPLISGVVGLGMDLFQKPEVYRYPQASMEYADPTFISASPGLQRIRNIFSNNRTKLGRYNPGRLMARLGELGAQESEAASQVAGQVDRLNANTANSMEQLNASNRTSTNLFNTQTKIRGIDAAAQNRGAKLSALSAHISNLGTMSGQIARDRRLEGANERYNNRMLDIYEGQQDLLTGPDQQLAPFEESLLVDQPAVMPDTQSAQSLTKGTIPVNTPNYAWTPGQATPSRLKPLAPYIAPTGETLQTIPDLDAEIALYENTDRGRYATPRTYALGKGGSLKGKKLKSF